MDLSEDIMEYMVNHLTITGVTSNDKNEDKNPEIKKIFIDVDDELNNELRKRSKKKTVVKDKDTKNSSMFHKVLRLFKPGYRVDETTNSVTNNDYGFVDGGISVNDDDSIVQKSNAHSDKVIQRRTKFKEKHKQKRKNKKRFVVGKRYILRIKPKHVSREERIVFECRKFVYTVKGEPLNIVIMKNIGGIQTKRYSLSRLECEMLHIKYEEGLEVWPMSFNWIPEKEEKEEKIA